MTLSELTELIDRNLQLAAKLQLRLSAKVVNGFHTGIIFDGNTKVFEKSYNRRYHHLNSADMQGDFNIQLLKIQAQRLPKVQPNVKLQSYKDMTMAERAWYNKAHGTQEKKDFETEQQSNYEAMMRKKAADEDYGV